MATHKRLVAAWFAGTLTIYFWGALSHLVLLKGAGFSRLPDDQRVVTALQSSLESDGLYFFPSPDFHGRANSGESAAFERRFLAGPTGMIVYHSAGGSPLSGRKLAVQLLADMIAAGIAVYLIRRRSSPRAIVSTVGLLGVFAIATVATIFWNWYGFPDAFFFAQCLDMIGGWSLTGVAIAVIVSRPNAADRPPLRGDRLPGTPASP